MKAIITKLYNDENGAIISAELILVMTIVVLSMVVGLSELAHSINQELEDVASAFGSIDQSFQFAGLSGHTGDSAGAAFWDEPDHCDGDCDIVARFDSYGECW